MSTLSPRAQKAQRNAAARDTIYYPRLARTSTKAVILRPATTNTRTQRHTAKTIADKLPEFRFNTKRNWWESDNLEDLAVAYMLLAPYAKLSPGAQEYLEENHDADS